MTTKNPKQCHLGDDYPGRPKGDITVYAEKPNGGNCDFNWEFINTIPASSLFAAIPKSTDYGKGAHCGRCVKIKCSCEQKQFDFACRPDGKETIAMITDSCPPCHRGDIDLSYGAWDSISGKQAPSRYDGTWDFVECPDWMVKGNSRFRFKPDSHRWWYAIQVRDAAIRYSLYSLCDSHCKNMQQTNGCQYPCYSRTISGTK